MSATTASHLHQLMLSCGIPAGVASIGANEEGGSQVRGVMRKGVAKEGG